MIELGFHKSMFYPFPGVSIMPLWTSFPDQLDVSALSLVLAIARGQSFDKRVATLAAFNVIGYAANQVLPPASFAVGGMMAAPPADYTDAEIDEAFGKVMAANGTMAASPDTFAANGKYLQIVLDIALKVLPLILAL